MKKLLKIFLIVFITFLVVWVGSLLKCEYLTKNYGYLYNDSINKTYNIGSGYFKILETSSDSAKIYCVINNEYSKYAVEIVITNHNKKIVTEHTIWAYGGSADNVVWPYWWHTSIMEI